VPDAPWWTSIARQRGNADDVLLRHRYGWRWHRVTGAPRGRRGRHLATTGAAVLAAAAAGTRPRVAAGSGLAWLGLTAEFALRRVLAGPRTGREVAAMTVTSVAIPPLATLHWLRGLWIHRRAARVGLPGGFLAGEAVW
jgi:hypothetical protein